MYVCVCGVRVCVCVCVCVVCVRVCACVCVAVSLWERRKNKTAKEGVSQKVQTRIVEPVMQSAGYSYRIHLRFFFGASPEAREGREDERKRES